MKRKQRFIFILITIIICLLSVGVAENYAATKKTKAKTTATAKKKTSSTAKKKSTSTAKRKTSSKKATTRKKTTRKKTVKKTETKKPEEIPQNDELTLLVNAGLLEWIPENLNPGGLRVNSVKPDRGSRSAKIFLNENFTYLPVTKDLINDLTIETEKLLPDSLSGYQLSLMVGDKPLSYFITSIDKLPESARHNTPFVVEAEPLAKAKDGMGGDIVAMWASHGRYFKPGSSQWYWQRPQLFQVTEDTHTMSYILPYVVPMIENAGGYVLLPRERNINRNEVIVDNDTNDEGEIYSQPYYKEKTGKEKWVTGEEEGFIYDLPDFRDTENPFENGTYRQTSTITSGKESIAAWYADIPEDGEYAIYVSYKTLPNSTEDARYIVNYSGGSKEFRVNQTMGGGTWIYLGTFPLEAGYSDDEPVVALTNMSSQGGKIITADAVKIGGGMGNIARSDSRTDIFIDPSTPEETDISYLSGIGDESSEEEAEALAEFNAKLESAKKAAKNGYIPYFTTSGLPRYLEGARYWLQWAGFPEEVYSPYHGSDDYKDDYTSRGLWVNYLAGGSRVLPNRQGLNIPVDVAMALHSDAGKKADDSFIGTLGIYFTNNGDSYIDGTPRTNSRALTDMLLRQITLDIRQTWEPNWTRRAMWDKTYVEARVPEVPTSLVEFMSHQNYADMKYALDPAFRFTVSRSIYKAIGRFIAERKDRKFVVQPLPVKDFEITRLKKGSYKLAWNVTHDKLEPTAEPDKYIIMERTGDDLGFHKIAETSSRHLTVKINDNKIHSFRIIAANDGGVSFPSETLALREAGDNPVLIINGFTRVSAPASASYGDEAGFYALNDFGVPHIKDISFIGYQTEFRRSAGESFGKSNGDYASQVIAGNTFDFPYIHGKSISEAGKGFVSVSVGAVENGSVNLNDFKIIDLILGKQKTSTTGFGSSGLKYTAFPKELQTRLEQFVKNGGDLLVSGAYVASDLYDDRSPSGSKSFANDILGISKSDGPRTESGSIYASMNGYKVKNINYSNSLNENTYIVENPDILYPEGSAEVIYKFGDTGLPAATIKKNGKSRVIVTSIPFETINNAQRDKVMKDLLDNLE
ncbi:MAG: xanthan lyase [Muribaculaceae bacterium]|nr:xanthan lyase [Muribaculaceae bacterium]